MLPTIEENRMSVVTPADISALPERYAIGKRPLSLLLGWGELTYTRLLDGNTPSQQHAVELRRLIDDPAAFARLLETGRNRITETAYMRSFRAVDQLLIDQGGAIRATRIFVVADRICMLAKGDLTPGALQRLVYYAHGSSFAALGVPLFDELPRAAAAGPEYERITKGYSFEEIQRAACEETPMDADILTKQEVSVIDAAYDRYGDYSGQALARMSREGAPWKKARKRADASKSESGSEVITAKSMKKFFSKK
jgi:uncharacterized phage-associated protein